MRDPNQGGADYISRKPKGDDGISFLDLVAALARHKWLILAITVIIAILSVGVLELTAVLPPSSRWNILPTKYKPTATLLVQDASSGSGISSALSQTGVGSLAGLLGGGVSAQSSSAQLAMALLKSRTMEDQITEKYGFVERYHLTRYPKTSSRARYEKSLAVKYDDKSRILEIGYWDIDRNLATNIVNDLTDHLVDQYNELTTGRAVSRRVYLEKAIANQEHESNAASERLSAFQNKYGVYDLPTQAQANITALAGLQSQIASKQMDLDLQRKYTPETDPRIVMLKEQISQLQNQIDQLKTGSGGSIGSVPLSKMMGLSSEFASLKTDVQVQQAVLLVLKQQLESAKLEEQDTTPTFQVIEKAEVPEVRATPNRSRLAVVFTIAGLLIGCLVALVMEYIDRARQDPEESKKLAVIGRNLRLRSKDNTEGHDS